MPTIVGTSGYRAIKFEYSLTDNEDKWGDTLDWLNAVCEVLYHNGHAIPVEWGYRHSPVDDDDSYYTEPQGYETEILRDLYGDGIADETDIRTFGDVLNRYADILNKAGESY